MAHHDCTARLRDRHRHLRAAEPRRHHARTMAVCQLRPAGRGGERDAAHRRGVVGCTGVALRHGARVGRRVSTSHEDDRHLVPRTTRTRRGHHCRRPDGGESDAVSRARHPRRRHHPGGGECVGGRVPRRPAGVVRVSRRTVSVSSTTILVASGARRGADTGVAVIHGRLPRPHVRAVRRVDVVTGVHRRQHRRT